MKNKLIALAITILFILANLIIPFFIKWYEDLLGERLIDLPILLITVGISWIGGLVLIVLAWIAAYSQNN